MDKGRGKSSPAYPGFVNITQADVTHFEGQTRVISAKSPHQDELEISFLKKLKYKESKRGRKERKDILEQVQ